MLTKILKYDIRAMNRNLIPAYIIVLLLGLLTKVVDYLSGHFAFLNVVKVFIVLAFIIALIGIFFYTLIVTITKFYRNILKEEGYLTNTLPVTKNTLVMSKFIASNIYFILTTIVAVLALWINIYDFSALGDIYTNLDVAFSSMGFNTPWVIAYLIFIIVLSNANNILMVYVSICLGQTRNDKKVMYSVIFGVAIYSITQFVGGIISFIWMMINPELTSMANDVLPSKDVFMQLIGMSTIISIIFPIVYYIISVKVLDKKLNLE